MADWTKEKIAALTGDKIQTLRDNAARNSRQDIVDLCDEELAIRKPRRIKRAAASTDEDRTGQYVCEFHFVCPDELGVIRNPDGTVWTGTWVVAQEHAENAVKYGALVSLHSSRAEPSYLQGTITAWRKSVRDRHYSGEQPTQIEEGIDFLFQPSAVALSWKGRGSAEKGYAWKPIAG